MVNMDLDGPQNVANISSGHQKGTNTLGSVKIARQLLIKQTKGDRRLPRSLKKSDTNMKVKNLYL